MHRWILRGRPHSHFRRRRWRFSSSSAHCRLRSNHRFFFSFNRECNTLRTDPHHAFHRGKCLAGEKERERERERERDRYSVEHRGRSLVTMISRVCLDHVIDRIDYRSKWENRREWESRDVHGVCNRDWSVQSRHWGAGESRCLWFTLWRNSSRGWRSRRPSRR